MQYMYVLSCFSCFRPFAILWTVVHQALLSVGFSRKEYWSGLPFPSPGDLPDPGIEPPFPHSSVGKESTCNAGDLPGFDPWVGKIPLRRGRLPTPVFWPRAMDCIVHEVAKSQTWLSLSLSFLCLLHWQMGSLSLVPPGKLFKYKLSVYI